MDKRIYLDFEPIKIDVMLLVLRIGSAALMLTHGVPKLEMLFNGENIDFPAVLGLNSYRSFGMAVFAEVFCPILLIIGLGTRFASLILILTMSVAVLIVLANNTFASKELAILYIFLYWPILILGGGKFSVDRGLKHYNWKQII